MTRTAISLAALLGLAASVALAETPIKESESAPGKILTDTSGMTLYTFDKDQGGMSACYDDCAKAWPPLLAAADAVPDDKDFGIVERTDGTKQWTFYGKPLYLWMQDKAPGDVTGDGVKGVWHAAEATGEE
ncbi:MAG: hypothetical protein ACKVPY_13485 [Paracoccaceae bacterium]